MPAVPFENTEFAIRSDIIASHIEAWGKIASPGTWLDSKRRLAVAAEIRRAQSCVFCMEIKNALSPFTPIGTHQTTGLLYEPEVELIHRGVNDPGRLSKAWADRIIKDGLSQGEYVEIVGIIASVMIMDTMTMALGSLATDLPDEQPGEPSYYMPPGAKTKAAWLPIIEPQDVVEMDEPLYPKPDPAYIYRALSMVPESLRNYWALAYTHYIPGQTVGQYNDSIRAITRPQIEIIAARVSGLHQCTY